MSAPPPPPPPLLLLLTAPGCSCGPVAVEGNTYAAMAGQGQGCRTDNSKRGWCEKTIADFCGGKDKEPDPIPASGDTCGGQTAPVALRAVTIGDGKFANLRGRLSVLSFDPPSPLGFPVDHAAIHPRSPDRPAGRSIC